MSSKAEIPPIPPRGAFKLQEINKSPSGDLGVSDKRAAFEKTYYNDLSSIIFN